MMNGGLLAAVTDPVGTLRKKVRRASALERALGVLRWDQEVMMPPGGTPARAEERSALASLVHDAWTSQTIADAIERAEGHASTPEDEALVREARWRHERRARVPDELIEELADVTARAHPAWAKARREDNFGTFAPFLEKIVDLRREYAHHVNPDEDAYTVLFEDHEPWLPWETAQDALNALATGLAPLIQQAPSLQGDHALKGTWVEEKQRELMNEILQELGYDFDRGRLDESEHPFSTGNPHDARITTRLHEDDLASGLTSTVHEFGHALYTQNLPREHLGTPLGKARDLVVHEANARFWENHIARSLGFWEALTPKIQDRFDCPIDPLDAWRAVNRIQPGAIRVDADELTYHAHIVLRTRTEKRLIDGSLSITDAPTYWNEQMLDLLGIEPSNASEGILQDVHWSHGSIGYFPTYSLGSLFSAQIAARIEEDIAPLPELTLAGQYAPIRAWLEENIHRHGQLYTTPNLIEEATGSTLTADAFLTYAEEKYERVWEAS